MGARHIFWILLLFPTVFADLKNPMKDPLVCGRPLCDTDETKFKYLVGKKYQYSYNMLVRTEFAGAGDDVSELQALGMAEVFFPRKCEGVLRLQSMKLRTAAIDPQLFDEDGDEEKIPKDDQHVRSEEFASDLEKNDLRFAFHDGLIGEVCAEESEEAWVLNIKKSILSTLQNTMNRFDIDSNSTETDVSGVCDVSYQLIGTEKTNLLILKTKDIASCKSRYKTESVLQTSAYDFRNGYAAWPALNSQSICNISINHHVYNEVNCRETHLLAPFSNNGTGAFTEARIHLILRSEYDENYYLSEHPIHRRSPLLYDHTPSTHSSLEDLSITRDLLKQLCQIGFPNIQREFPDVFVKFLHAARVLSDDALQQLLQESSEVCESGSKHLTESLPYIGSTASILLMKEKIISEKVSPQAANDWMFSMSFIIRPNDDILDAMYELLVYARKKGLPDYILSTTSVVATFCKQHSDCETNPTVQQILTTLEEDLTKTFEFSKRTERDNAALLLKALGNIGVLRKKFETVLKRGIIETDHAPVEVRVQAVQAFRRTDCLASRDYFLDVYKNFTIQSEVRIAAYVQTMRCPDYISVKFIKYVLKSEQVNQVGSYVWSHLHNLLQSSSPVNVEVQGLLADAELGDKFNKDRRRFSRNYEYSLFFDEYNFGYATDSNLIFGTDSYLPKAASVNFTTYVFGEAINFLEVNTRAEGFEHLVESVFGPKGPLNADLVKEKLKYFYDSFMDNSTETEESEEINSSRAKREVRGGRALKPELENSIDQFKYNIKNNPRSLRTSVGIKIFGNDLKYRTTEGELELQFLLSYLNPKKYIGEIFSGKDFTYTKSGVFLDAVYQVPLVTGVPLSISALGASSVDLRYFGKFLNATDGYHVEVKLKPSISLDVITTMKSDFFYESSGIKVKANLYSSAAVEAKLKIGSDQNEKRISLQVNLPQERNEILSTRSEILVVKQGKEIKQKGVGRRYSNSTCTWPIVERAVGLKLCADFSLPDVSNTTITSPSLLLSGPVELDIHLEKADPTARVFQFEYLWKNYENFSEGSVIFHTPGSAIPREFSANASKSIDKYSAVMSFKNGEMYHSAEGNYHFTDTQKQLDVSLNLNGKKYLALEMGMNRSAIRNGIAYYPKFLLEINNDKIAGLVGIIKVIEKKQILQWDIETRFETKRLQSRLNGYIIRNEASITSKLSLWYEFIGSKEEQIDLEVEMSAKQKGRTRDTYTANLKLQSTAYPKLNFILNNQYQQSMGHMELKTEYTDSPGTSNPENTLTTKITFAKFMVMDSSKTNFAIQVTRPHTHTDFMLKIMHEEMFKQGKVHTVQGVLRYAPEKQIDGVVSVYFPLHSMYGLDILVNVTAPSFKPFIVDFKLNELNRKEYSIMLNGTWFSGHTMTAKGWFQDRSSVVKRSHHLKLLAQSPSFEDTNIDVRYSLDQYEMKLDAHADYCKQPYGIILRHSDQTNNRTLYYAEVKWREKLYSIRGNLISAQTKQLAVEAHLDKYRDIELILKGISNEVKSEAGIELKWDANRDPTQKLIVSAEFNTPAFRIYDGNLLVSYPDRAFSGVFNFVALDEYKGTARLAWSLTEAIEISFKSGAQLEDIKNVWLIVKLNTPFVGWRQNALDAGLYSANNLMLVNSSFLWAENQNLGFEVMSDYAISEEQFRCHVRTVINSTVDDIPPISFNVKHEHDERHIESEVGLKYTNLNGSQNYHLRSKWDWNKDELARHLQGALAFKTPFEKFTTGTMVTKLTTSENKEVKAAADVELEGRRYTMVAEGYLKKITDCWLVTNITTPNERFRTIVGRFGISEMKRHVVAEISAPIGALGGEVLFYVVSTSNFNIKISLATPAEAFSKLLLIARLNPEMVDLRGGWNKAALGFTGVWRKKSMKDFEYSYRVYTPIELLEYNGVVIKFVQISPTNIDIDMSLKLASYKLGLTTLIKPKPKLIKELGKQKSDYINKYLSEDEFLQGMGIEDSSDEDSGEEEEDDDSSGYLERLSFAGNFKLDTIVYPTITGTIDLEEIDYNFYTYATIKVPQGTIEIRDRFYRFSRLTMKNRLKLITPFPKVKELLSESTLLADVGANYVLGADFKILGATWTDLGAFVNLTKSKTKTDKMYNLNVRVVTPLKGLPYVNFNGLIESHLTNYLGNITVITETTNFVLAGNLDSKDNFFDSSLSLSLAAPLVPHYYHRVFLYRAKDDAGIHFKLGFENDDNLIINEMSIDGDWLMNDVEVNTRTKLFCTFLPLRSVQSVVVAKAGLVNLEILYLDPEGRPEEVKALAAKSEDNRVRLELKIPQYDVKINGVIVGDKFVGNIGDQYIIDGNALFKDNAPVQADLTFRSSSDKSSQGTLIFSYADNKVHLRYENLPMYVDVSSDFKVTDKYNWHFNLLSKSSQEMHNGILEVRCEKSVHSNVIANSFDMKTPWKGLESLHFASESNILTNGYIQTVYQLPRADGNTRLSWSWELMKNMRFKLKSDTKSNGVDKALLMGVSFEDLSNELKEVVTTGDIHVNNLWILSANASYIIPRPGEIDGETVFQLPLPVGDTHKLYGTVFLNRTKEAEWAEVNVTGSYEAVGAKSKYAGRGFYKNDKELESSARVEWGPDKRANATQFDMKLIEDDVRQAFIASAATPYYLDQNTLKTNVVYGKADAFHVVSSSLFIPESVKVTEADVAFASMSNMKGMVNATTPFLNVTWLRVDFDFNATKTESIRYLKGSWPNNTAILDAKSTTSEHPNGEVDLQGTVRVEVPVQTRHMANIAYGLKEKQMQTIGHTTIEYNDENILTGQYKSKMEVDGDTTKNSAQITLNNNHYPLGINYYHTVKDAEANYDIKRAEVFELNKNVMFNITGELHIKTEEHGQEYKIVAIHPNRTVVLTSDHYTKDETSKQKSKIELAPTIWIGYDIHLKNLTTPEKDTRWFYLEIFYPRRNLSANGSYSLTEHQFDSNVDFQWEQKDEVTSTPDYEYDYGIETEKDDADVETADDKPKHSIKAGISWKNEDLQPGDKDNQTLLFTLGHPSFEKDVTFKGNFFRSEVDLLKLSLLVDYSSEAEHLANFTAAIRDLSTLLGYKNYSAEVFAKHDASELWLNGFGTLGAKHGHYETSGFGGYKRGYLPLQEGVLLAFLDLRTREIKYYRSSPSKIDGIWLQVDMSHPVYTMNSTFKDSPDIDGAGTFILDFKEKFVRLDVNMTPDANQNLRLLGTIPDSRQAYFDLHRDFEDIRVTDIAYYIRLNHSRLITSHMVWRPTLKAELKEKLREMITNYYDSLSNNFDYWIKTIYSETKDSINDIVREANPKMESFLNDCKDLGSLETDIQELMVFFNESYQADDFYIRSVLNFTLTVLDELAVKNHIASVPKIFKEMWQVLGDSGETLRKSIKWLLETLEKSYKNALDMISGILHGDALSHISAFIESGVQKYDKFAKDLHMQFIKYVERLYNNLLETIQSYWERALQNLQPSLMKLLNYVETMSWNLSKEILDFIYQRTGELVNSPYFNQFYNITADFDRLYKDMTSNDAFTNIKKYSIITYRFLKEKYFRLVPFGKELNELLTELTAEVKELEKLEFIQVIIVRVGEVTAKLEWLASEFQVEKRMHQVWGVVKNKLTYYGQTALEADNKHREAKTKFIFDPDVGVIDLAQKLPMAWHAFNETPKFDEIPEYKLMMDVQEFFETSNFSLWNAMYEFNQMMEFNTWLPPFKAHSILIGSRHFITFDGNFVSLDLKYLPLSETNKIEQCSYLLSKDFQDRNFTLLIEPSILKHNDDLIVTRKLSLIAENKLVDIDIAADAIRFGRNLTTALPARIGDTILSRDADVLTIESHGSFIIQCNLQFDLCSFDVNGWYFGKTAGLLGSINNEDYDDITLSDGRLAESKEQFINSWALPSCKEPVVEAVADYSQADKELLNVCDMFFKSKVSYFTSCYSLVDTAQFYEMCIDLGMNSLSNVVDDPHPSIKGACTAALAYIEVCTRMGAPLRIPDTCVHCTSINGSYVPEGAFINITADTIQQTSDIVFIVEAKSCNKDLITMKSLVTLLSSIDKELKSENITENRYAVVTFGGQPPFNKARSVVVNNKVFVPAMSIFSYFSHIQFENGTNKDIFDAISVASKLLFRPGASKTFILMACSSCNYLDMNLDYSSILQVLLENGINLHILTDFNFKFDKTKDNRSFFGLDKTFAYTKNDFKDLLGDEDLRKYVNFPKKHVGVCGPIALETNGTIFSATKLKPDRKNQVKKFATVFGKRVAKTAHPNPCQVCECTGHNTGVAYMICTPCRYPSPPVWSDFGDPFDNNMQSGAEWEPDDDDFVDEV